MTRDESEMRHAMEELEYTKDQYDDRDSSGRRVGIVTIAAAILAFGMIVLIAARWIGGAN